MGGEKEVDPRRAIELLEQVLQVEYRFIVHYPRLMEMTPDNETREIMRMVGEASVRHADTTAQILRRMGAIPPFPGLEPLPDLPVRDLFQRQLEYEKLALMLYSQAAELVAEEWQDSVRRIAEEEQWHIQGVERILGRLGQG